MPNYHAVIDKLFAKSEIGAVPWKPTADDNTFIAALEGEITFQVSRLDGTFQFVMQDKEGRKIIDMICENREQYDRNYAPDDEYFPLIRRLFEAARVTALEVDKKLDIAESLLDKF